MRTEIRFGARRADNEGQPIPRHYQAETLARAVEYALKTTDPFIVPVLQKALGPAPISKIACDAFLENRVKFVFRMRVYNTRRKQGTFALVTAKREGAASKLAEEEFGQLRELHGRAPGLVLRPLQGGPLSLQKRRSKEKRRVYAYLAEWVGGFHGLGVGPNGLFFAGGNPPSPFSLEQTDAVKGRILEVIAATYDRRQQRCIEIPQVHAGDLLVTKPGKGGLRVRLAGCRKVLRNITVEKLLHRFVTMEWPIGKQTYALRPHNLALLFEGLERALGRETARDWMSRYAYALEQGALEAHPDLPADVARRLSGRT